MDQIHRDRMLGCARLKVLNAIGPLLFLLLSSSCGIKTTSVEIAQSTGVQLSRTAIGDTVNALGNNIMVVFQDQKGNYWFGSWVDGLYRYDGTKFVKFTTVDGLSDNRIDEIKEDDAGNVYVNTPKGVSRFDGNAFTKLMIDELDDTWKLEQGDMWFRQSMQPGFVLRYDGQLLHRLKIPEAPQAEIFLQTHSAQRSTMYDVYTIYEDSHGNVWFGTSAAGACRFDGKEFDWISEPDVAEFHDGPSNGVRSIVEDRDGYLWFNSMYRYDVAENSPPWKGDRAFYRREKSIGSLDTREDGNITEYLSIAKDNKGDLWFATYLDGVWHYDGKDVTHFPITDGSKEITVFSIYKDNAGELWLGTHENGAYKFNGQTFERFNP